MGGTDVRRRRDRQATSRLAGLGLLLAGGGLLIWQNSRHFTPNLIAALGVGLGLLLVLYSRLESKLERRNMASDEIFQTGYDRGYEDGHDKGCEETGDRPVVIDINARRCSHCQGERKQLVSLSE